MIDSVLHIDNVSKYYGDFAAVKELSLEVPKGSIYGFLGPNGAGKTTLIRMILSILNPSSGNITVLGASSAKPLRSKIGYLPEEKGLYKKMKAVEIVAYLGMLRGMKRKIARVKARSMLQEYGLDEFADAKCEALSKGMQQKVQILAAIVHNPEFVILDEPFSGLDPVNQEMMEKVIHDLRESGSTVIFSTHIMEHAERLCDRFLLVAKGKKIFDGTIAEAARLLPRCLKIETESDPSPLSKIEGVTDIQRKSDSNIFEIQLSDQADADIILRTCFEKNIQLRSFHRGDPSLRDIFVFLVGKSQISEEDL